ncbi:MAG: 3-methyl-2-oxobutanoate hydroxymethyltransferase [Chthonomonas sp.]|nr:3-methyl-2-oxobutanoate hydroxymethyltransferase [Chthonomonas sp.]
MAERISAHSLPQLKANGQKIVSLTAYSEASARIADAAGVDFILVGDSVGSVVYGQRNTVRVTLADMVRHTMAARAGCKRALLVADLPLGTYNSSIAQAVDSAVELVRAGAEAVKLEGTYTEEIKAIIKAGIPVMGHLGMTPQSVHVFGGHKVQGKQADAAETLLREAQALEAAGVFAIVIELVVADVAAQVSRQLAVPTIGIGSGVGCDGQIQVFHDLLGLTEHKFKHAGRYLEAALLMQDAVANYAADVRESTFPRPENSF